MAEERVISKKGDKTTMPSMTFDEAAQKMRETHGVKESDMEELYALYKQATVGDVNKGNFHLSIIFILLSVEKPGIAHPVERRKWDAWEKKKGMSSEKAKEEYIKKAESLL